MYWYPLAETKNPLAAIAATLLPSADDFKKTLCSYLHVKKCVLGSSGRALLYLLLAFLKEKDNGKRNEVLIPGYTCYSVAAAIARAGLKIKIYDFYHYAFPILKKYNAPATVFLPTDFIDSKEWFWTDQLACLFYNGYTGKNNKKSNHPVIRQLYELTGDMGTRFEKTIEMFKEYPLPEIKKMLEVMTSNRDFEKKMQSRAFLSWDEVRKMKASGLISFASHTAGHRILTTLEKLKFRMNCLNQKQNLS